MNSATYIAKVLEDGHLSLPESARRYLKLKKGDEIEVHLYRQGSRRRRSVVAGESEARPEVKERNEIEVQIRKMEAVDLYEEQLAKLENWESRSYDDLSTISFQGPNSGVWTSYSIETKAASSVTERLKSGEPSCWKRR